MNTIEKGVMKMITKWGNVNDSKGGNDNDN